MKCYAALIVVSHRRFGTGFRPHLQGSSNPRGPTFQDILSVPFPKIKHSKKKRRQLT